MPSSTVTSTPSRSACSGPGSPRATGSRSGRPTAPSGRSTQYATAKIGAILVNVNPAYRTHELAYVLNQSGAKLLISATEFKTSDYRAMVEEVRTGHPAGAGGLHRHRRLGRPDDGARA